ncbi:MAG: hypothetical protein HYS40_04010 [Gemmatimonadetes bacterium]|nr:hypothetical protein [Gemmatimonadota bacterium]
MLAALSAARALAAQDSQFGVRGLGTPGRWESVRARATGGAFGAFDVLSPLTEVGLLDLRRLTASAAEATSYRTAELLGQSVSLRTSRFPVMSISGPLGGRLVLSGGFTTYLDRSFHTTIRDSVVLPLRGTTERYTDEIAADGAVSDMRLAAALRLTRRVAVGAAVHLLEGSTRSTATRRFDDSTTYQNTFERQEVRYDGFGVSASAAADIAPELRLAGWMRSDTRLRTSVNEIETSRNDLPTGVGGAVRWMPSPNARFAGAVAWRSWSDAGPNAHDAFGWSLGAELGSQDFPLRVGARGGQMAFGPGSRAPTEVGFAVGTARSFSDGRARIDVAVERLNRTGGGLQERVWTILVGLTVQP